MSTLPSCSGPKSNLSHPTEEVAFTRDAELWAAIGFICNKFPMDFLMKITNNLYRESFMWKPFSEWFDVLVTRRGVTCAFHYTFVLLPIPLQKICMQLAQVMTCVRLSQGFETCFKILQLFFELYATVLGKLWGWFTRRNPCRMDDVSKLHATVVSQSCAV